MARKARVEFGGALYHVLDRHFGANDPSRHGGLESLDSRDAAPGPCEPGKSLHAHRPGGFAQATRRRRAGQNSEIMKLPPFFLSRPSGLSLKFSSTAQEISKLCLVGSLES